LNNNLSFNNFFSRLYTFGVTPVPAVIHRTIVLTACLLITAACEKTTEQPTVVGQAAGEILNIYTVNYPLAYFARRIGGEFVTVSFPAPAGVDPAIWRPAPQVILDYQQADLILLNGAGYATWAKQAALSTERMVDTSTLFKDRLIRLESSVKHQHGPEGDAHTHGDTAFTTWLDPELAALHAESILAAIVRVRPEHVSEFTANYELLLTDLQNLDTELSAAFKQSYDTVIMFSHPVYQYLARKYGVQASTMHWEPGQPLSAENLQQLVGTPGSLRLVIWEGQPLDANIDALSKAGYLSVVFNPAANPTGAKDYLDIMAMNASKLRDMLQ
jgi:zinc transport system substrate-binding protein